MLAKSTKATAVQPRFVHAIASTIYCTFSDLATGVNTNKVEEMWSATKNAFERMNGVPSEQIQSHLDEWLFQRKTRNVQANASKPHHGVIYGHCSPIFALCMTLTCSSLSSLRLESSVRRRRKTKRFARRLVTGIQFSQQINPFGIEISVLVEYAIHLPLSGTSVGCSVIHRFAWSF